MTERIMEVTSVSAQIGDSSPPTLMVGATGKVSTSGWSNPELTPFVYINPPADGIQDFDFVADKPTGITNQLITPVKAKYVARCENWVKGVRVHAANNKMENGS
ncbi:MAG: hypothetical protein ABIO29_07090 [Sphingomicrobium sp.]